MVNDSDRPVSNQTHSASLMAARDRLACLVRDIEADILLERSTGIPAFTTLIRRDDQTNFWEAFMTARAATTTEDVRFILGR